VASGASTPPSSAAEEEPARHWVAVRAATSHTQATATQYHIAPDGPDGSFGGLATAQGGGGGGGGGGGDGDACPLVGRLARASPLQSRILHGGAAAARARCAAPPSSSSTVVVDGQQPRREVATVVAVAPGGAAAALAAHPAEVLQPGGAGGRVKIMGLITIRTG
jgi:hypothetical protein